MLQRTTLTQGAVTLKVHPSGWISQGYIRTAPDLSLQKYGRAYQIALNSVDEHNSLTGRLRNDFVVSRVSFPSLGLSTLANLRREKSVRGRKGMTSYQRHQVRDGCTLLENQYGRKHLSFFTGTLPTMEHEASNEEWRHLVKLWRDRMVRALRLKGLPDHIVACFEVQEKRLQTRGELCLHIHAVFVGRNPMETWAFSTGELQQIWNDCLKVVFKQRLENANLTASTNVQRVKKSAVGYLGKYMSKSISTICNVLASNKETSLPSTWVMLTQSMKQLVKQSVKYMTGHHAENVLDLLKGNLERYVRWSKAVTVGVPDGSTYQVGWVALLKGEGLAAIG